MKKFIISGIILLILAICLVVGIFTYIQYQIISAREAAEIQQMKTVPDGDIQNESARAEGIPLNTLPINDSQQKVLETVGVNPDTFVITPTMIECAQATLGMERYGEIIAGAAPSFMEGASLLKCKE